MNYNHDHIGAAKLAFFSFASSMAGQVPAIQDLTESGQLVSVIVSIVTSIIALVKMFKKKKG
jgi:hypothetical protein